MLSEIPQLQVVTAILDSDDEDYISQLLFSQGWSIIFRAIDIASLRNFLAERSPASRTVLVYKSDLPGWSHSVLTDFAGPNFTPISLDGISVASHELMSHIRTYLRTPLVHEGSTSRSEGVADRDLPTRQIITITGTSGAPGRSTLAINLAEELSLQHPVELLDADMKAPSLPYLLAQHASTHPNRDGHHPIEILDIDIKEPGLKLDLHESTHPLIVDIGVLPALDELLTDRRWQAVLLNQILNETSQLIYLSGSTGISLIRQEEFMKKFPLMLRKIPIIYLLNQSGAGRIDRAVEERFLDLVEGEQHLVMPTNSLINKRQEREAMARLVGLLSEVDRRADSSYPGRSRSSR